MYKKFICLFMVFGFAFLLCGCHKLKRAGLILFNKSPITKETLLNNSSEFVVGKRIYYIFITENPLKTDMIRVRVLKREEKVDFAAVKVYYSNDFRLYKDQVYYYNDYIVINEAGTYCMMIYATNALDRPLAVGDFLVKG